MNDDIEFQADYLMNDLFIIRRFYKIGYHSNIVFCEIFNVETKKILQMDFKGFIYFYLSHAKSFILYALNGDRIIKINCMDGSKQFFNLEKGFTYKLYQTLDEKMFFLPVFEINHSLYIFNMKTMTIGAKILDSHPIASNATGTLFAFLYNEINTENKSLIVYTNEDFKQPLAQFALANQDIGTLRSRIQFIDDKFLLIHDLFGRNHPKIRIYSLDLQEEIACYENILKLSYFNTIDNQLVAYDEKNGLCQIAFPQLPVFQAYITVHKRIQERVSNRQ